MEEQTKSRSTWWTIVLIALAIVGVVAIAFWVSGAFARAEPEGPEIPMHSPAMISSRIGPTWWMIRSTTCNRGVSDSSMRVKPP